MTDGVTSAEGELLLAQIVRVPDDGIESFRAFEAAVLPLLQLYDARLESRLRSLDGGREIHVVRFPSQAALDGYLEDPARQEHLYLLRQSRAVAELIEVTEVREEHQIRSAE